MATHEAEQTSVAGHINSDTLPIDLKVADGPNTQSSSTDNHPEKVETRAQEASGLAKKHEIEKENDSMALVLAQPGPTPPLTIPASPLLTNEKTTTLSSSADLESQKKFKKRSGPRRSVPILVKILVTLGTIFKITFLYVIPGSIFVILAFAISIGLPFAMISAQCAAAQVIGNSVLKAAKNPGYSTNAHAGAIGATGGAIAGLCLGLFLKFIPDQCLRPRAVFRGDSAESSIEYPWYITFITCTLLSTLAGVIGCAILLHNHVDLGGYDVVHAARAAAVGGIIYAVGMALAGPVLLMAIGIIMSPVLIAMSLGAKWVYIRANDSWEQRGDWTYSRYSHCYCYGFCERDDEIDAELAKIGH
ncbi:hypothetical protein CPB83DRAFT_849295 [Crepidotus variabilis]|uniref:Uncharacterized protein n=1 Tax=Crepidotus variabilis TaxID=179855 RepID=A0A9P6JT11_9AGAR|nr:hypothetical protein CPB83DRAFT_849295 [Crepidotus variabilis]